MTQTLETRRGPVLVRPTREEDAEAHRELRIEGLRAAPTAFGTDAETSSRRTPEEWLADMRAGGGEGGWLRVVAETPNELAAMIAVQIDQGSKVQHQCHIFSVYVRPAWRGLGILDSMINFGLEWAKGKGVRIAKLSVTATNTAAIRAYTRLGFSVYGIEPEVLLWQGTLYDELLMYRRLVGG